MSLNKKLDKMTEAWEKYKHEDIEEANVTGNIAGYETPKAFGDEDEKENDGYRQNGQEDDGRWQSQENDGCR